MKKINMIGILLALILLFISVLPISALSTVKHNKSYKLVQSWIINNDVGDNDISSFLLSTKYDQFQTISSAKKAIRRGLVFINNVKANNDNNKLIYHGDVVTYMIPVHDDQFSRKVIDYDEIPIVYEDDHFAIVVKPQGMSVFTTSSKDKETNNDDDDVDDVDDDDDDVNDGYKPKYKYSLSSNVIHQLNMKASDDSINMLRRAVPVHRLDRDTGGLVVVAKTTVALTKLSEMFSSRLVKKRYRAIVSGKLSNIGSMNTMLADIDGKQATTEYCSTAHITTSCGNMISIVDLYPLTGRKHQLRKHMKLAGCPILNDPKYCENSIPSATELKKKQMMMLWALGLSFHHPITTEFINVTIPEPEMFSKVVEKLTSEVKPSFVYLLESSDKSSYVGATKDLTKRLRQHNREIKGGALVTGFKVFSGQKWTRVCHITDFPNWIEALRFEWSWKFHSRSEKKLLRDYHALNPQTDKETKTEKIRNPDTNKLIKIGGLTWRKLVLEGKVDGVLPEMLMRLSPLERRMLALKKIMSFEKSTKKALEYRHWPKSGPQIQWENQLAKQIYDQLT